jgi:succinate dehydrogenase/fumarate reductase cytochrome b subunit (b558 family)
MSTASQSVSDAGPLARFLSSTLGKKTVMAVTGFIMFGFVVGHLVGNLQVFAGDGGVKLNAYAAFLKNTPALLWGTRIVVGFSLLAHVWAAAGLKRLSNEARPVQYKMHKHLQSTAASKNMFWGGISLFFYIIYHLLHLTVGVASPIAGSFSHTNIYGNMIASFQNPALVAVYVFAMFALGHRFEMKLVNPANKRKFKVIVVGTGLAGGAGAATLAELGYNVEAFCYQDSPRRAHSIAAQGGINAAKNYQNDGDSIYRLFYDTVKGGDFRARESNVYRLAQVSVNIIDQCVAQGVPFAREYGGLLANRSFGGAQVSRTFYARGQTGQQLLLGAYQALERQIGRQGEDAQPRTEMLDLIVVDGRARGIVTRDLVTGKVEAHLGDAVVLATGGYGNVFFLSTNAKGCNVTAIWRATAGAGFANPCYTQIHPTCIPVSGDYQSKLTLMSESLRNDGRVWVPKKQAGRQGPRRHPRGRARLLPRAQVPGLRQPGAPRHRLAQRQGVCDEGRGVGPERGLRRLPRLRRRHQARLGEGPSASATATSSRCTSASPARTRTRSRCASTPRSTTRWAACGWTTT